MRKITLAIIFLFIATFVNIGCNSKKTIINETNNMSLMYNSFEKEFTYAQFDSICVADTIDNDIRNWYAFSSLDGETNEPFVEYLYIKSLGNNECTYRLYIIDNNTYKISKRIRKK